MFRKKVICALSVAVMLTALSMQVFAEETDKNTLINVDGTATVFSSPDMASINFIITDEAGEADEALKDVSEKAESVTLALKDIGVEEKSITTLSTDVYPRYGYDDDDLDERYIIDYTARITINVADQGINTIGDVIAEGMKNGADEIDSLRVFCSNYEEKYEEALALAVENARKKAEKIAEAAVLTIVGVSSVDEGYQNRAYEYVTDFASSKEVNADYAATGWSVPISAGSVEISANVSATYICK